MTQTCLLLSFIFFAFLRSACAAPTCQPEKWRELSNEKRVISSHSYVFRKQKVLTIETFDHQKRKWLDEQEAGAFSLHRVIEVDPQGKWVLLFEPAFDSQGSLLFHRKSGLSESLNGCVIWSSDRTHFATISEDGGSGRTPNEIAIWGCEKPEESCQVLWKRDWAGREASFKGKEVTLSAVNPDEVELKVVKIRCKIEGKKIDCKDER